MSHLQGLSQTSSYLYWKKSILQYSRNWWVRKMDKVENLEYWLAKFYLSLSIISQDIDIERISFLPINQGQ